MKVENELGVIVKFAQEALRYGFTFVEISEKYPDAIIEREGKQYRVEFESSAKNFVAHRHDIRQCDIIVCWENDYPDCILPILELSQQDWGDIDLTLPDKDKREIAYWKQRALIAERKVKSTDNNKSTQSKHLCKCGNSYETYQGLNAHKRFCELEAIGQHNGHGG